MQTPIRIHLIAAARPNFMKVAPLWHALSAAPDFEPVLIHTGQHYDLNMSEAIFADLRLPVPDHHLGVGSGSHAEQTGRVMVAYEKLATESRPDWLIVAGDVNSTAACAMAAAKLRIPIVHLEAGLRSRDRDMPEEVNRLVTDVLADLFWTPSEDADANLLAEGVPAGRISRVGNIMMDSLEMVRPRLAESDCRRKIGLHDKAYAIVTLHRPSNVDDRAQLERLVEALIEAQGTLPLVFPVHPRTKARLAEAGLEEKLAAAGVRMLDPLSYIDFMSLVLHAAAIITDSGGIQEETTYLGIPCLTLRDNTERPITVSQGTNRLVKVEDLAAAFRAAIVDPPSAFRRPENWDGQTAARCIEDLRSRQNGGRRR